MLKKKLLVVCFAIVLSLMAIGPDLIAWIRIDGFAYPIRAFVLGDQEYYADRLHRVVDESRPIGNPYYWEHKDAPSRFALFEWTIAALSPLKIVIGKSPILWHNIIRLVTVISSWLILALLIRRWALRTSFVALTTSFLMMVFWGAYRSQEWYALEAWFMPFHLLGLLLAERALNQLRWRNISYGVAATLAYSTHPFAFAVGVGGLGLAWLTRCRTSPWRESIPPLALWAVLSSAIGYGFFGAHAAASDAASHDALVRGAPLIMTHRPMDVFIIAAIAGTACLAFACRRRFSDPSDSSIWDLLVGTLAIGPIIGFSNIITGRYFVLNHVYFFLTHLAVLAAVMTVRNRPARQSDRISISMTAVGVLLVLTYAIDVLRHTSMKAVLYLGTYVPYFSAALMLAFASARGFLPIISRTAMTLIIIVGALYPTALLWRLNRNDAPRHAAARELLPILIKLKEFTPGVVMSNGLIAEQVARHTSHYPYWSHRSWIDQATDVELLQRWRDHLVFFNAVMPEVTIEDVTRGIRGLMEGTCRALPTVSTSCVKTFKDETAAVSYVETQQSESRRAAAENYWRFSYRLDILVLDAARGEHMPVSLADDFEQVWSDERFAIYQRRQNPSN